MAVNGVPELKAHFNAIPEPFTVASLTPLTYVPGRGPVTIHQHRLWRSHVPVAERGQSGDSARRSGRAPTA